LKLFYTITTPQYKEKKMFILNNVYVLIGIRCLVFATLIIFIFMMERYFRKAGIRGRKGRTLQIVAAFIMGVVVRGLVYLIRTL
jgi:hypothetical protein